MEIATARGMVEEKDAFDIVLKLVDQTYAQFALANLGRNFGRESHHSGFNRQLSLKQTTENEAEVI